MFLQQMFSEQGTSDLSFLRNAFSCWSFCSIL